MATSKTGKLMVETGQSFNDYSGMTDSGDQETFTVSGGLVFSAYSGKEVEVRPNGIVSGADLLTPSATSDNVTVGGFTAYSEGVLHSVSSADVAITRPASNVSKVISITMTDAGALAAVAGTDGTTTAFSETRDADGGPPLLPADSVELGQVRVTTLATGAIATSEIFQVVGTHAERFDLPSFTTNNVGDGKSAEAVAKKNAYAKFDDTLPSIHTGDVPKGVYVSWYTPILAEVPKAMDFIPAENTHSLSSVQYYNGTVGSTSSSLGQCSFTALNDDNITDTLVGLKDKVVTTKFFPDRNRAPYILTQGIMGVKRTFPVGDQNQADCTISAENPSADFSS